MIEKCLMNKILNLIICEDIGIKNLFQLHLNCLILQSPSNNCLANERLESYFGIIISVLEPSHNQASNAAEQPHHPVPSEHMIAVEPFEDFVGHLEDIFVPGMLVVPAVQEVPHRLCFGLVIVASDGPIGLDENLLNHNQIK